MIVTDATFVVTVGVWDLDVDGWVDVGGCADVDGWGDVDVVAGTVGLDELDAGEVVVEVTLGPLPHPSIAAIIATISVAAITRTSRDPWLVDAEIAAAPLTPPTPCISLALS